jgi:tetratricopeptide (TPR) repeat protein
MTELAQRREALRPELSNAGRMRAIETYREALRTVPHDAMMRRRLAELLLAHGEPAAAEKELRRVIRRLPHQIFPQVLLGRALNMQEDYEGTEGLYRGMLELFPKSGHVHGGLATALARQGDFPGAIKAYRTAVAVDPLIPSLALLHHNLGQALAAHGNPKAAIEEYRAALELDPALFDAHLRLGALLIKSGRASEAVPVLRRCSEQDPSKAEPHFLLGDALRQMRQTREALAEYQKAVSIDPLNPAPHKSIARILWSMKDYDGAWAAVQLCRSAGGKLDPKFIADLKEALDPEEAFYRAQVKKYGPPFGAENRVVGEADTSFNELAQAFWGFAEWLEEYNVRFRYVGGPVFRSPTHSAHDEVTVIAAIGWYGRLTKPSAHVNRIFAEWQRRYSFTAPAVHVIDEGGNQLISQDLNGQTGRKEELERDP